MTKTRMLVLCGAVGMVAALSAFGMSASAQPGASTLLAPAIRPLPQSLAPLGGDKVSVPVDVMGCGVDATAYQLLHRGDSYVLTSGNKVTVSVDPGMPSLFYTQPDHVAMLAPQGMNSDGTPTYVGTYPADMAPRSVQVFCVAVRPDQVTTNVVLTFGGENKPDYRLITRPFTENQIKPI